MGDSEGLYCSVTGWPTRMQPAGKKAPASDAVRLDKQDGAGQESGNKGVYRRQWQEYKRRNRIFWCVFLTYVPGVLLIGYPLSRLFGSDTVIWVVAISWMVAFLIAQTYLSNWKCPRCGKRFLQRRWSTNTHARKCLHCGLPKWAQPR